MLNLYEKETVQFLPSLPSAHKSKLLTVSLAPQFFELLECSALFYVRLHASRTAAGCGLLVVRLSLQSLAILRVFDICEGFFGVVQSKFVAINQKPDFSTLSMLAL